MIYSIKSLERSKNTPKTFFRFSNASTMYSVGKVLANSKTSGMIFSKTKLQLKKKNLLGQKRSYTTVHYFFQYFRHYWKQTNWPIIIHLSWQGCREKFRALGQKFRLGPLVSGVPKSRDEQKNKKSVRRCSNFGPKSSDEQKKGHSLRRCSNFG